MEKITRIVYAMIALALAALLLYYFVNYRLNVNTSMPKLGSELVQVEAANPIGEDRISGDAWNGTLSVSGITGKYCHLMFYSIHQCVEVYFGDELIYSMAPSPKNAFAKTPGCVWNDVLLTEDMNEGELTIRLTPTYHNYTYKIPDFYVGEKGSVVIRILKKELFSVIVSLILMLIGMMMIGYVAYNRKNSEVDKDLVYLGGLAFLVGTWRASEASLTKMMFHGLPVFALLPFMAILLMVVPFVLFMMNLYNSKGHKVWYVPCCTSLIVIYADLFLQYFNIADFREGMVVMLITLGIAIFVVIVMAIRELWRNGLNAKLRSNLLGMTVVVIGVVLDVFTYYVSGGKNVTSFVILGFLLYAIALGLAVFRENNALITAGKVAQSMENLAYHDKLTGLFNRAAFIMDTDPYVVDPENYVVAVLDLNNLKYCNDHLGHEMGDKYICDSAEIIKNTFGTIGNCYRMGGDEFYCLIPKGGKASCREQQTLMEQMIEDYNKTSEVIKIGIACGFARYDNRIDYDLNSTAKRADQLMYQNKEEMKKQ